MACCSRGAVSCEAIWLDLDVKRPMNSCKDRERGGSRIQQNAKCFSRQVGHPLTLVGATSKRPSNVCTSDRSRGRPASSCGDLDRSLLAQLQVTPRLLLSLWQTSAKQSPNALLSCLPMPMTLQQSHVAGSSFLHAKALKCTAIRRLL